MCTLQANYFLTVTVHQIFFISIDVASEHWQIVSRYVLLCTLLIYGDRSESVV